MPIFMLGRNNRVLHSVSYSLLVFLLLFFLFPFANAENLYNDKGNDSCLTIFSDSSVYRPNDLSRPKTIDVFLTIENKCGLPVTANLGLATETKHTSLISIASIEVTKGTKPGAITKSTGNVLPFTSVVKNFESKQGWESVVLQDGNTEIKMVLTVPLERGEFAITIFNPLNPAQQSTLDPFYDGDGSAAKPYQIRTCVQLQDMNSYLNNAGVYFELGADINCATTLNLVNDRGLGFLPVGTEALPFKGHFDGNNFVIRNLMVYQDEVEVYYAGLFGKVIGAKIRNVGLIDFNVWNTQNYTGALVGRMSGSAIQIDVNNVWVWSGKVVGVDYVGGLFGGNMADVNQAFVKDTNVFGTGIHVGGISGFQDAGDFGSVWHAYSTAKITGGANAGGMAGDASNAVCTESYWNVTDCGVADNGHGGTVITQAQQKKQASYVNWNFVNIWKIVEDMNTPMFIANPLVEVYPSVVPDFNFVSIEDDLFVSPVQTYAYILDGNLTIDFNASVSDGNQLYLDLNYGNPAHVVVKNLTLTTEFCTSYVCHLDFNIHRSLVADGNYFLKAVLRTAFAESTTFSDQNFLIANDVNIVVKKPIDEETGLPIDTTTLYRWTVRIYDAGGLQYYPNQKDQNGFRAPIGETIIITIDTNESLAYYPRQYSLLFTEATATYTLQPYLIKQSVSGNFIFNVTNIATAAPISGVQIKIFGFVPGLNTPQLQTITTDAAGLATIPLRLGSPYTVDFYYNGVLVHSASITPTTASLYYQVQLNIAGTSITPEPADYGGITTIFYPTSAYLQQKSTGAVDINVSLSMLVKTFSIMRVRVLDTNGCLYDNNVFTGTWTDGNTVVLNNIDLNRVGLTTIFGKPCFFDEMFSVYVIVDVNSTDGNQFSTMSIKWQLVTENNYRYNLLYLLPNLATSINGNNGKLATTFIAFLVLITCISAVGAVTGGEPIMAAILTLGILGLFVMIGFVDFLPFAFICIATFFGILYMWGRFG